MGLNKRHESEVRLHLPLYLGSLKSLTMKVVLPFFSILFASGLVQAQITIDQSDYGTVGDTFVIGNDIDGNALPVGGPGAQTWDFSSLEADDLNTYKFEDPANTVSGQEFPGANVAIQRLEDTLFFNNTASLLELVGMSGNLFTEVTQGAAIINMAVALSPPLSQVEFPSTYTDAFTDVAYIDTTVGCAAMNIPIGCDSARLKRRMMVNAEFDAYGSLTTPSETYPSTLRQYYQQMNYDTAYVKFPFLGWQQYIDTITTVHTYRWFANGEDWPVLTANANAQNGNMLFAEFKIGAQVVSQLGTVTNATCYGTCNGSASASGLGGTGTYSFTWDANAGGQTTATATGLCAGTYQVTVSDGNSSDVATVTITEPDSISINFIMQGVSDGDGSIDITAAGGSGTYTYLWEGPEDFIAATEDIANLEALGVYTVTVTDGSGCSNSRSFSLISTGLGEITGDAGFTVFPNPANESITIYSALPMKQITITNMLGEKVLETEISGKKSTLDLNSLEAGTYFIQADGHAPKQIVKVK